MTHERFKITIKIARIMPMKLLSISANFGMLKNKGKNRFCTALFSTSDYDVRQMIEVILLEGFCLTIHFSSNFDL